MGVNVELGEGFVVSGGGASYDLSVLRAPNTPPILPRHWRSMPEVAMHTSRMQS